MKIVNVKIKDLKAGKFIKVDLIMVKLVKTVKAKIIFLIFGVLCLLSGCMVGPNYQAPKNDVSNKWHDKNCQSRQEQNKLYSDSQPLEKWWESFDDELLDKYVVLASKCNQDILTAQANMLQARALRQVTASALFPQINAGIGASRTEFSRHGRLLAYSLPGFPPIQNLFNVLFDASWEIDFFGKTKRSVEAESARVESAVESKHDILISVTAEVAKNYLEVRSYQEKVKLLRDNIRLLEENLKVVQQSVTDGYKNQLDLESVQAELSLAKSQLPDTVASMYRGIYALSFLVGKMPEALFDEMIKPKNLPDLPYGQIFIGLRSDLLRRRPDIRRAERNLAAATAEVGVAVASFFPAFTLSADLGLEAVKLVNLFRSASKTWEVGGDMNTPIFEGGRLMGNLRVSQAGQAAAMHTYQKTVLNALQETQGALVTYQENVKILKNLKDKALSNQALARLSSDRYAQGLVDIVQLIKAQREFVSAQEKVLNSLTASLLNLVSLYKALGGGWQVEKNPSNS